MRRKGERTKLQAEGAPVAASSAVALACARASTDWMMMICDSHLCRDCSLLHRSRNPPVPIRRRPSLVG